MNLPLISNFIAAHERYRYHISRYAPNTYCFKLRFTKQNAENLRIINSTLISFNTNAISFDLTLNPNYFRKTEGNDPEAIFNENLMVSYKVHK